MPVTETPLFKLVSLRKAVDDLTVDPTDDDDVDLEVMRRLDDLHVDPSDPSPEVLRRLSDVPVLTGDDLESSPVAAVRAALGQRRTWSLGELRSLEIDFGGHTTTLQELVRAPEFRSAREQLTDSWLTLRLRREHPSLQRWHEQLLRAAHLGAVLHQAPDQLREPGAPDRSLRARVVLPRQWRPALDRSDALRNRHARRLARPGLVEATVRDRLAALREQYTELSHRIEVREELQAKAYRTLPDWFAERVSRPSAGSPADRRRIGGGLGRIESALVGRETPQIGAPARAVRALDDAFYDRFRTELTTGEAEELDSIFADLPNRPAWFGDLVDSLDIGDLVYDANRVCAEIQVYEVEGAEDLPEAEPHEPTEDRPSVRAVGWGDLIVARERLVGYAAREIAHIENVLAGEEKLREHERTRTVEEVTEREITRETESERDLQTTNRYELQHESQRSIEQEFSIQAGVNTSGRYGMTEVETSLDVGFQQSQTESQSTTTSLAKDVVSRAVERTFEAVRELRRLTITEQIRELNRHALSNIAASGDGSAPASRSGLYLWVEKQHEVELRQYGTRLMVEFHIPEPALSLLEFRKTGRPAPRKPARLRVGPTGVNVTNYLCLTRSYGVEDVQPPPARFIEVGFAWASTPIEEDDYYEDTVKDSITIPDGYRPISATALAKGHPDRDEEPGFFLFVAVGGTEVINRHGESFVEEREVPVDPAEPWPTEVPVSIVATGHHDRTLALQVALRCERTEDAMTTWRLRTWERIRAAHLALVREYEQAVAESEFAETALVAIEGRPEAQNREIERDELKKWAIKTMRLKPFDFNAVEQMGDYQEIDPLGADAQAPIVRFLEEAFEWREMTYFLYPYFWGRRDAWPLRQHLTSPDPRHDAFLRAGAARVIVPVTPGSEGRVLYYLESDPADDELDRIAGPPSDDVPDDTSLEDLWLELLIHRNEALALGSGTLSVQHGSSTVAINDDSAWETSERDLGRELYIAGDRYVVVAVPAERAVTLDANYRGGTDPAARYATGSVPYGPPWLVNVPTSLVILSDEVAKLPVTR